MSNERREWMELVATLRGRIRGHEITISELQISLGECRRLLRFVIDHGIRTTDGTKTIVWQHEWEEFLVGVENAKGGGDE